MTNVTWCARRQRRLAGYSDSATAQNHDEQHDEQNEHQSADADIHAHRLPIDPSFHSRSASAARRGIANASSGYRPNANGVPHRACGRTRRETMGLGVSLFLIAVGAVLAFAVNTTVNGLDIVTVGWILMLVGGLGAVLSLLFWSSWGGFAGTRRQTTYVERDRELL